MSPLDIVLSSSSFIRDPFEDGWRQHSPLERLPEAGCAAVLLSLRAPPAACWLNFVGLQWFGPLAKSQSPNVPLPGY